MNGTETREYWEAKLDQAAKDNDEFGKRQAESRLAEIDDAARDEERQQRQQAEVEAIALPQDYDAYYGVQGLNEEIQALLRQVVAAKNEEHNAEIGKLQEGYRQRSEADAAVITDLRDRAEEAEATAEHWQERAEATERQLHEEKGMRKDAEEKRDNAVRLAEETQEAQRKAEAETGRLRSENASLRGQINELESMLRTYKTANKPSLGALQLTSTLPSLSEDELKARRERDRIETINRNLAAKYPDVPPLPSAEMVDENVTDETIAGQMQRVKEAADADAETFQVVHGDSGATEVERGAEEAGGDAEATNRTSVEERLAALEAWKEEVTRELDMMGISV